MAIPETIKKLANYVRSKVYADEVQESIALGMEETADVADESDKRSKDTERRQDHIEARYDVAVGEHTEDTEVLDARVDAKGRVYPNIKSRIDDGYLEHDEKLQDFTIIPDDYKGTDFEKVQHAVNDAILKKTGVRLSRIYDLTYESPILLNKTGGRWTLKFLGEGGGFKKNDGGFMFSSENNFFADLSFINVGFESIAGAGTTIIDGDRIIIINTNMCTFNNVDKYITTQTYLQSIRSIGDRVTGGTESFIEAPSIYDLSIDNILVETREGFFRQLQPNDGA